MLAETVSAQDMYGAVMKYKNQADVIIGAAAVGDFTMERAKGKIKSGGGIALNLKPTKDIMEAAGKNKGKKILIGFSAESSANPESAPGKIKKKNLDYIVFNDISKKGAGFESDANEITVLDKKGRVVFKAKGSKEELAGRIIQLI